MRIRISTSLGEILAEIDQDRAPRTAAHFLSYVDEGYYNGASFYRTARSADNQPLNEAKIDIIEGGYYNPYYDRALRVDMVQGLPYDDDQGRHGPRLLTHLETTDQTGLRHLDGTLSLGRTDPDKVDDSLVICVGDQPELDAGGHRHPDGLGFPAFGRVVAGMDLVRRIYNQSHEGQKLLEEVRINSITRV